MSVSTDVTTTIHALRAQVASLHAELTRWQLVAWTAGNVSARVPGRDLLVIKPSGVSYDELSAEAMVVCDLDGTLVEGEHAPSSDTAAHAYVYKHLPEVGGVVHTHSTYATAWAARGEAIPCVLTMVADEFGGDIPCAPYADNEGDHIAEGILRHRTRGPAVLLAQHGVFAFDATPARALKAAVMVEDVARTLWLARQLGPLRALPPDEIDKWWDRYHSAYGQG